MIQTTPDRLAAHGHRRCGIAQYDHQVASTDAVNTSLAMIIDHLLGPLHPGYTEAETIALDDYRRNPSLRPHDPAALASALALRDGVRVVGQQVAA